MYSEISEDAVYETTVANPDQVNPVANPNTSRYVSGITSASSNNNIVFDLPAGITAGITFSFSFRFYSANSGASNSGSGRMIVRMYNSTLGTGASKRINLPTKNKTGGEWEEYTYSVASLPDNSDGTIVAAGGFDRILIIPSNNADTIETLYFDDIELSIDNSDRYTPLSDEATLAPNNQWFYNNSPNEFNTSVNGWGGGTEVLADQATPKTTGNSSPTVLKFTRNDLDATTGIKFDGASLKYDEGDGKITVRVYPVCNADYGIPNLKIRTRFNNAVGTQIQNNGNSALTPNQWNEVSLDLTDPDNQADLTADGLYNEVYLIFNQGINIDTGGNPAVFYIDALQVPVTSTLSVNDFDLNNLSVYPNPAKESFQIKGHATIESVKLYTIRGRLIKTFSNEVNYDISDLTTGIYIVKIKSSFGSKTLKIQKK